MSLDTTILRNSHSAHEAPKPNPAADDWQALGSVTVDTEAMLLIDPVHGSVAVGAMIECDFAQIAIGGGNFSAIAVVTGMGDGRYAV